jgi:hypothetical protein
MTTWQPDTCDCLIENYDEGEKANFINRCKLHQDAKVDDVLAHNRSFNMAAAKSDDEKIAAKSAEKERIKSLQISTE